MIPAWNLITNHPGLYYVSTVNTATATTEFGHGKLNIICFIMNDFTVNMKALFCHNTCNKSWSQYDWFLFDKSKVFFRESFTMTFNFTL